MKLKAAVRKLSMKTLNSMLQTSLYLPSSESQEALEN